MHIILAKVILWFAGIFLLFILATEVIDLTYYNAYYKHLPKDKQEQIDRLIAGSPELFKNK